LVGAIAQVTTRLKFVTTVYIPAMRDPYAAAKAIGTAAYLSDGRVELGIGVGWCEEEFTLMGQRFDRRGKRTDEMLKPAARNDGWIGDLISTDRAIASVEKVRTMRAENGLSMDGFEVLTPLTDAFTPEHYERAEAGGITGIITMPWMFYAGPEATLSEKIDGMKRFRKDLALDR
jgi:hypothetical protein